MGIRLECVVSLLLAGCGLFAGGDVRAEDGVDLDRRALAADQLPSVAGFPNRPIRLVVYTSPGGLIDFTARKFAEIARLYYPDQPYVVINRPGGGGVVAFEEVLQGRADGYEMLAVTRSNVTKLVASRRDDLLAGVDWHSYVMDNAHVLITNTDEGLRSWGDVKSEALERGDRQIWLGVDIGGVKHISGVRIARGAGVEMRWIPYASGGQAVAALMGGLGSVYLGNPRDARGQDNLKIIAVCGRERLSDFPDAPTFAELGIPGLENERIWRGFAFQKGVPEEVREWHAAMVRLVTSDPEWKRTWANEGVELEYRAADVFSAMVAEDIETYTYFLREIGLLRERGTRASLLAGIGEAPARNFLKAVLILLNVVLAIVLLKTSFRHKFGELMVLSCVGSLTFLFYVMTELMPPPTAIDTIGARGVPRLWIYLLIPLAFYQTFLLLRDKKERKAVGAKKPHMLFLFLGVFASYVLLLPILGYYLTSAIYLPLALWVLKFRNILAIAGMTALWLLFAYVVFQRLLYVDLPTGLFLMR